jgi:outer membrane scaffolding protein for murein synthesis (MipA/OmpV family)
MRRHSFVAAAAALSVLFPAVAFAQEEGEERSRRVRVGLGAQLVPSYPGSDDHDVIPLVDVAIARGDDPFDFEAADESFGFSILDSGGFEFGPALNIEGSRKAKDVGAPLNNVSTTIEVGAFVEYKLSESFRVRTEARRGIGGHEGWTGNVGADYVIRDGDAYLFSIGPRVTLSNGRYHRAYFGVTPAEAVASGLPAYRPDGGVQAVGGTAGFLYQLSKRWGLYSYAKYDRLVGDAARSPIVRQFGSRHQLSGGLALTYTFGGD